MGDTDTVATAKVFRSLVESADRKFARVRDLPTHGSRGPHHQHYFHKVFKAYTKLWKFQQENRSRLVQSGLNRWEIGEIASRIGQLYYGQYLRTSEARFLLESYVFYEAILNRGYFEAGSCSSGGPQKDLGLRFKELRFFARFLVVSLLLNRTETVRALVDRFRALVDDSRSAFPDTNFKEWKQVVQEIVRFLKADTAFMNIRPLRYCMLFDSHPASLPHVARFHARRILKLKDAVLTSYHRNEVKFTELTLDTFRMLQCLEWEPSGSFYQMRTKESSNNGAYADQSGPSGLIDINLAADMTDPTLPPNPRKYILYRPSVTHLISVIATICEELPPDSILLLYISASGKAGQKTESSGASKKSSNCERDSSLSQPPISGKRESTDCFGSSLFLGSRGSGDLNNLHPGDIIPFTRRPLFLIIDSDNSHAFKVMHGAERGEKAALLLSPGRPTFQSLSSADLTHNGSQFTFFLTAPLQAFCQLVGFSTSDTDMNVYNEADTILSSGFSEWEVILCTSSKCLDLVWAQVLSDPFLRRLILRFIFCRSVLSLFRRLGNGDQYLPDCLPHLPDSVSPTSAAVEINILRLAKCLGVESHFHFTDAIKTVDDDD
ncbi:uncharacterized protein LOC131234415 [Magnolia sinica]|uniref:uncharacterized protein LOC131234415 n=1 Tax=Magnolia sinica TaxID=86752 RepID=UPI00265AE8C6|nr:uncharacterized protein LOC131234415 [Magnolia sinica]